MILNRLNSDNTQEAVVPGMEFRLQPPFILYGKESGWWEGRGCREGGREGEGGRERGREGGGG